MKKTSRLILAVVLTVNGVYASTIEANESNWAFSGLLSSANETTVGWFFNSEPIVDQTLAGYGFAGVTVGQGETSGSDGILSWSSASGYYNPAFVWTGASEQSARDTMSLGGLWCWADGVMSLDIAMESGQEYIIELVSMQASGSTVRTMDIAVDGGLLADEWTVPSSGNFNQLLRFSGISDGNIDVDFSMGSSGDTAPAFSIITVTQVPEPASVLLIGLASGFILFVRRRFPA